MKQTKSSTFLRGIKPYKKNFPKVTLQQAQTPKIGTGQDRGILKKMVDKTKRIVVVSGPTGSGESTITQLLIKKYPIFKRLVTATTRKPRLNEKNKKDYYFFTDRQFKTEIKNGNILEYVFIKNRGVYYGSYKPALEKEFKNGYSIIANTEHKGTIFFKKKYRATAIFLKAESLLMIKKRLLGREPNMSLIELKKRLDNATKEIKKEEKYYDYVIINRQNKINETIKKIESILKKEGYWLNKN